MTSTSNWPQQVGRGDHRVVVLHGWFGTADAWAPVQPVLDLANFHYVFPDYRGYGRRKGETGAFTVEEAADDVVALVNDLGWDSFSIVGHSMGGSVMQQVLLRVPDRVRALVGVSPVPACGVPFDEGTREFFQSAVGDAEVRRAIIDRSTGGLLTATWLDAMARRSMEGSDVEAFAGYLTSWAGTDFHEEVIAMDVPVKVLIGANDPDLNQDFMKATYGQWYSRCDITVLASAGHYAMDEAPILLATEVEAFLKNH